MNDFISTIQAAKILGISRIAVFNKIKSGEINAVKVGRNYIIHRKEIDGMSKNNNELSSKNKKEIDKEVDKVIKEYGETLKLLQNN